jgi:hypothetical protein
MPEGIKLTQVIQGEVLRCTESEIIKAIQKDDDINKEMTNVNDTEKVAEMINDVSKGTEKLMIRIKKKVYEVSKRNKKKPNAVVMGQQKETRRNLQNVLKRVKVEVTDNFQRVWV